MKKAILLVLWVSLLVMVAAQTASATHPVPANQGAKKATLAIVPAFKACQSPNTYHGPPLATPSCAPPRQTSPNLTIGRKFQSAVTLEVFCTNGQAPPCPAAGDQQDIKVISTATDVRCKAGTSPCPRANSSGGQDYAGELRGDATIRITDAYNSAPTNFTTHATLNDLPFPLKYECAATADTTIGGSCRIPETSVEAMIPDLVKEGKKAVVEIAQVHINDGGSDGDVETAGPPARPNSLFAVQGIYIP
jgi:hypothetical protein